MAYGGQGQSKPWAAGVPIIAVIVFGLRMVAMCGRSTSSYSPSFNYTPPPNIPDYSGLLASLDAGLGSGSSQSRAKQTDVLAVDSPNVYCADAMEREIFSQPK